MLDFFTADLHIVIHIALNMAKLVCKGGRKLHDKGVHTSQPQQK